MKKSTKTILNILLVILIVGALVLLQTNQKSNRYALSIIQRSMIYAVVAVAMNLLIGFTGLFSLGQAGFMAIGAYVFGIFTMPLKYRASVFYTGGMNPAIANIELPVWFAMILGGLAAALFAAIIGYPILRLKSDYLAIATLGFSEIIRAVISSPQLDSITNGSYGLKRIPSFDTIYTPFLISAFCIFIMVLLINSSYGRAFKAIREDEVAAEAMGINLSKHKQISFVVSSFFTGIGGALLAAYMGSIDGKTFSITLTYDFLLIVVLGGMGSVTGSIIGSFLVIAGRELLRFFDNPLTIGGWKVPLFRTGFRMVIFSILLMVIVLFFRRGIMGDKEFSWDAIYHLFTKRKKKADINGGTDNG